MNILYIHQYFVTPEEPGGTRSYWIARELIKRGHNVTMITATNTRHPENATIFIDGIKVIYIKNEYSNYMSASKRIKSFMRFVLLAIKKTFSIRGIDLAFATSTPLSVGIIVLWLRFTRGWHYVFEVRDLWPEGLIQEGITNPIVVWALKLLEKMSYHNAEHVIALSPGMKDGVMKVGTKDGDCTMVPNMSKPDKFYPHEPNGEIIKQFGIKMEKFNLIHFGTMGYDNYNEYIVEAAKLAQEQGRDTLNFILLGDGSTVPSIKKMIENYRLTNIQYLGSHKMNIVSEIVNCCDASITSFRNIPILATNSPNKLFDSLSAGKPIIVNSAGWTKDLVENENCGCYVNPENPQELVDALMIMQSDPEKCKEWSRNSRRLSVEVYDKSILSAKVADTIEMAYNRLKKVNGSENE